MLLVSILCLLICGVGMGTLNFFAKTYFAAGETIVTPAEIMLAPTETLTAFPTATLESKTILLKYELEATSYNLARVPLAFWYIADDSGRKDGNTTTVTSRDFFDKEVELTQGSHFELSAVVTTDIETELICRVFQGESLIAQSATTSVGASVICSGQVTAIEQ